MRLTASWALAGLALGVPALLFAWLSSLDQGGQGVGWFGLIVLVVAIFAFVFFASWALVVARPRTLVGRSLRRLGLAIAGLMSLGYGLSTASILLRNPESVTLMGPAALLLLSAGVTALYALVRDLISEPPESA